MKIDSITAAEVHDSRGKPTVMVTMRSGGVEVSAKVPSGKSAGSREAVELRDVDGVGVTTALQNVQFAATKLVGQDLDPREVDTLLRELDGTEDKSHLGANATLGISIAAVKLAAALENVPLWQYIGRVSQSTPARPRLYMNMLNGGAHASFRLPFQEYIVAVGGGSLKDSYAEAQRIFERLGVLVKDTYHDVLMGDEGGYSPSIEGVEEPFTLLRQAVGQEQNTFLAIDAAASEFCKDNVYALGSHSYTSSELLDVYTRLSQQFPLLSIEDPFDEKDFSAFEDITRRLGEKVLIVGDDLTVTNPTITREMIGSRRANAMIIKPNQIGTISEVFEVVRLGRDANWKLIASHRSGETDDTFISDLAVGIGAYGIKAGAPSQQERRVKYERLVAIEEELTRYTT